MALKLLLNLSSELGFLPVCKIVSFEKPPLDVTTLLCIPEHLNWQHINFINGLTHI